MDYSSQLPPEILTDIFRMLQSSCDVDFSESSTFRRSYIRHGKCWAISHVCKYWREVALASRFLWRYLPQITIQGYHTPEEQLEMLTEIISRAKDAPLHVSVVCSVDIDYDSFLEGLAYLVDRSEQWESFSLIAAPDVLDSLFAEIRGRIPRLEALCLSLPQDQREDSVADDGDDYEEEEDEYDEVDDDDDDDDLTLVLFEDAPMLKYVHITGRSWRLDLDTQSLVYLYDGLGAIMHDIHPTHEFALLTTLEVHDRGRYDYTELESTGVILDLPALKTLTYRCWGTFSADEGFLLFAVTPVLESLSVTAEYGDVITAFINMRERTDTIPLKNLYLRISTEECFPGDFAELLRLLPELETLDVNFPTVDDILPLAISRGSEVLVPRLKDCSFTFDGDDFDGVNTALMKLASSRCEPSNDRNPQTVLMNLKMQDSVHGRNKRLTKRGFGGRSYNHVGIQPTRLEPWYGTKSVIRSAYTETAATIPAMMFVGSATRTIDVSTTYYRHTLELIERVEQKYKGPRQLVNFLEANVNICLLMLAYRFKHGLCDSQDKDAPLLRVIRLLKKAKGDLMTRLADFHWIWEAGPGPISIRYIHNYHDIRTDPDKFANAVVGLSDDLWILEA